jgi:hypothetical protein
MRAKNFTEWCRLNEAARTGDEQDSEALLEIGKNINPIFFEESYLSVADVRGNNISGLELLEAISNHLKCPITNIIQIFSDGWIEHETDNLTPEMYSFAKLPREFNFKETKSGLLLEDNHFEWRFGEVEVDGTAMFCVVQKDNQEYLMRYPDDQYGWSIYLNIKQLEFAAGSTKGKTFKNTSNVDKYLELTELGVIANFTDLRESELAERLYLEYEKHGFSREVTNILITGGKPLSSYNLGKHMLSKVLRESIKVFKMGVVPVFAWLDNSGLIGFLTGLKGRWIEANNAYNRGLAVPLDTESIWGGFDINKYIDYSIVTTYEQNELVGNDRDHNLNKPLTIIFEDRSQIDTYAKFFNNYRSIKDINITTRVDPTMFSGYRKYYK